MKASALLCTHLEISFARKVPLPMTAAPLNKFPHRSVERLARFGSNKVTQNSLQGGQIGGQWVGKERRSTDVLAHVVSSGLKVIALDSLSPTSSTTDERFGAAQFRPP